MSNVAFPVEQARYQTIGAPTLQLTGVASGAAHTYGAWVSLGGSFDFDVDAITLVLRHDTTSAQRGFTSLAVGAGADASMVVQDVWNPPGYYRDTMQFYLPISIARGQTIFAKTSRAATVTPRVAVVGISGLNSIPKGYSRVTGIGVDLANSQPFTHGSVAASDTWVEVQASAAHNYRAVLLNHYNQDTNLDEYRTRIGVGAAGFEVSVAGDHFSSKNEPWSFGNAGWRPCWIPGGSRIALSCRSNVDRTNVRTQILGLS